MATFYVVDPKGSLTAFPSGGGAADLSSLDAGNLVTGTIPDARFPATLPAASGVNLTALNASNLASGTIPVARVSGLTNTQIDAAAAIAYSKLALTGSILNADINAAAAIAWTKLSKSGSSLADLATVSAAALTSGTLPVARLANGVTTRVTDTSTSAVNNWAPGLAGNTYVEWSGASDATFTGLSAAGSAGQTLVVKNTGSAVAYFAHNSASSTARFKNTVTSSSTPIAAGGSVTFISDGTNWQLVLHEQGAWIAVPFSAGDFTGSGVTWTVESGDVKTHAWKLCGSMLTILYWIDTTTISGTGGTLLVALPNSFTWKRQFLAATVQIVDNGTNAAGYAFNDTGSTSQVKFLRTDSANLTASSNNTYVRGNVVIEIN